MGLRAELPAAVYVMHHPGHGAVKAGSCLEPRQRRIRAHERRGWLLLADFATPTGRDAEAIERALLASLRTPVWVAQGWQARETPGLPGHGALAGCQHCGMPPATPFLRFHAGAYLSSEQLPQGGHTETFDARLVSPERIKLALYFAEAAHRARYYPPRTDGADSFERRRQRVAEAARTRLIRC